MRQGFLRFYVLKLISKSESPISGYALMKKIEEETGFWRPSPGSIYPLLASLEKDGLIEYREESDKKLYSLTGDGREALERAQQAKDEAMRSVRQSIHVFGELFGEEVSDDLARLTEAGQGFQSISPQLARSLKQLRLILHAILMQRPSTAEADEIAKTVEHAIEELKNYVKDD
ncbi:helix-turn-helix transcriptional regulator [Candidatus Bipolaricaulota bacterium]|nr:helix-turn-helix transcriptional regulator [Candidatus Bipolaricaulota bacterium]